MSNQFPSHLCRVMRTKFIFIAILSLLSILSNAQNAQTVPGEILIKLNKSSNPENLAKDLYEELGMDASIHVGYCVSKHMNIWLFTFDENSISKEEMLRTVRKQSGVEIAQANHVLEERILPDDPFFGQQWHHQQAEDHDVDTDLAWDITTGGQTVTGDDIVVCVVEIGGAQWNTADIADNHWVNELEIPDNGIDDDDNGYVDDYDGWNINSLSDELSAGDHGTRVSSMIGAKGNNAAGVTGVNWDVDIMMVQIGGSNEASAIAGYEYPMIMRKLYNETSGQQGAFVVATNSSWGTNNGQPEDAPLWCAMYDSLGYYGVLSCGSTTNSNADVDAVGDLPTACPSEFLISVARTNSQDIRASGGYGITTIDLAAPGDNVYLANNTGYNTTTGTSFSSPCVAGAIALLYSAPCNSIIAMANTNPAEAATAVKNYIMNGVDQTTQLVAETVSGGRLNVFSSLNLLIDDCDNSSCLPPFGTLATKLDNNLNYEITWNNLDGVGSYDLQYRIVGEPNWIAVNDITSTSTELSALLFCTDYEVQLRSHCETETSNWSDSYLFTSDGCCVNPDGQFVILSSATSSEITWNDVLAAQSYEIVATPESGDPILFDNVTENPFVLTGLSPCTMYFISISSNCDGDPGIPDVFTLHTAGCEDCAELDYCAVTANSNSEHIAQVTLGNINRTSENDDSYILVTDQTTTLNAGSTYTITVAPGYTGGQYNENFRVWIDYNSDEDFDDINELVFDAPNSTTEPISAQFTVPVLIADGSVRMRVAMSYTPSNSNIEPSDCGDWNFGEIEDYCVQLDSEIGISEILQQTILKVYPNPADDLIRLVVNGNGEKMELSLYDTTGKIVIEKTLRDGDAIDVSVIPSGLYYVKVLYNGSVVTNKLIIR